MAIFGVKVTSLLFFQNRPAIVGDPIHVWIDLTRFTVIPANPLEGTIRGVSTPITVLDPATGNKVAGREYTVEVADGDMPDGAPTIDEEHMIKAECPNQYQFLLNRVTVVEGGLFTPSASIDPSEIGDLVIEATNDTTLTFKLKGSDDIVRSGTIALT